MDYSLKIGIVEDNHDLRESLVELLARLGHAVSGFACAEDLADSPSASVLDLLIVDLNLPGEDGLTLATRLKRVQPGMRVVMMTTRTSVHDRVRGYDAGGDVYLPKPVAGDELVAVVRALARQIRMEFWSAGDAAAARLLLDAHTSRLLGPNGATPLNAVEVSLLSALARAPGQRLEYWQLMEVLGLEMDESAKASLAVKLTRLRSKFAQAGCPGDALKSLRSSGYQLCVPLEIR